MPKSWKDLSIRDKAAYIRQSVSDGMYNLGEIRNRFDEGGDIDWQQRLVQTFEDNSKVFDGLQNNNVDNRDAAQYKFNRSDRKLFDSVTEDILNQINQKQISEKMSNGGIPEDSPLVPMEQEIMDFTPVGDIFQGAQAINEAKNKNYLGAAALAGALFLPNALEAPIKRGINGVFRSRRIPTGTIDLYDAIDTPYKNTHLLVHDVPAVNVKESIVDLNGESRLMSPSMGVVNIGDYNNSLVINPLGYGEYSFVGNKDLLRNSTLYTDDALTPTVGTVWGYHNVPSEMRKEVANRITWQNNPEHGYGIYGDGRTVPIIDAEELNTRRIPTGEYFEAKYKGTIPMENFQYGVFPKPKSDADAKIIRFFEDKKFPFKLYDSKLEIPDIMLDIVNERPDLPFAKGGDKNTINNLRYNAKQVNPMYDYLRDNGLTNEQASGLLGNLAVESYLNADMKQVGGTAYGLMQAEGDRQEKMKNYDKVPYSFGSGLTDEEQWQLDYIINEGIKKYTPGEWSNTGFGRAKKAREAFLKANTVRKASDIITTNYLRPGKPAYGRRRKMSDFYYNTQKERIPYQIEDWSNPLKSWEEQ